MGTETKLNDVEKRILHSLLKLEKPISKTQLAKRLGLSPATVSRYVDVLALKGMLKVMNYNNIHLVSLEGKDAS